MKTDATRLYLNRQVLLVIILLSAMIAIGWRKNQPIVAKYHTALTVTARPTSDYLTSSAPAPTFTRTTVPTSTFTPTPSMTFTPSLSPSPVPTKTLTPSLTPIPPCEITLSSNQIVFYPYPGTGRTEGSVKIDQSSLIIYGQLANEEWWLASNLNSAEPQGWVQISRNVVSNQCSAWVKYGLERLAKKDGHESVLFADDFSAFRNNWRIDGKPASYLQLSDESYLAIKPVYGERTLITADNLRFPEEFSLYASLPARKFYDKYQSYLAWRFISVSDKDSYVEIRLGLDYSNSDNTVQELGMGMCSLQFIRQVDGNYDELPKIPLYRCRLDAPVYLNLQFARNNDETSIDGLLNNQNIPPLVIADKKNIFQDVVLEIVSFGIETQMDNLLIVR